MAVNAHDALRRYVASHETHTSAARMLGVSRSYLSEVLHKRKPVGPKLLAKLGLARGYVRVEQKERAS